MNLIQHLFALSFGSCADHKLLLFESNGRKVQISGLEKILLMPMGVIAALFGVWCLQKLFCLSSFSKLYLKPKQDFHRVQKICIGS